MKEEEDVTVSYLGWLSGDPGDVDVFVVRNLPQPTTVPVSSLGDSDKGLLQHCRCNFEILGRF